MFSFFFEKLLFNFYIAIIENNIIVAAFTFGAACTVKVAYAFNTNRIKETGDRVSHFITPGGTFDIVTKSLIASGFNIKWQEKLYIDFFKVSRKKNIDKRFINKNTVLDENGKPIHAKTVITGEDEITVIVKENNKNLKIKYSCRCSNVWGKPGLSLTCNSCNTQLEENC